MCFTYTSKSSAYKSSLYTTVFVINQQRHVSTIKVTIYKFFEALFLMCDTSYAGPSGHAVYGVGLRPLASWDCGSKPTGGMHICCACYVLSGKGLCVGLIARPEESDRLWCVVECDLEISWMRMSWPTAGCCANTSTWCNTVIRDLAHIVHRTVIQCVRKVAVHLGYGT
jgi:hypothetical protein